MKGAFWASVLLCHFAAWRGELRENGIPCASHCRPQQAFLSRDPVSGVDVAPASGELHLALCMCQRPWCAPQSSDKIITTMRLECMLCESWASPCSLEPPRTPHSTYHTVGAQKMWSHRAEMVLMEQPVGARPRAEPFIEFTWQQSCKAGNIPPHSPCY